MTGAQPMTEAEYYVLLALMQPIHGYGLMQRIRELSDGRMDMGPGTLYGVLTRMRRSRLIRLDFEDERRKTYIITDAGKQALLREYERIRLMAHDGRILETL